MEAGLLDIAPGPRQTPRRCAGPKLGFDGRPWRSRAPSYRKVQLPPIRSTPGPCPARARPRIARRSGHALGALALGTLWLCASGGAPRPVAKKLIQFGWGEPDPAFMRRHVEQMERSPFDGCVFHLSYPLPNGKQGNFTWDCWGTRAFTAAELQPALDDLEATRFRRFEHNFLRFNVTPANLDWFDDHSAVFQNAYLAARIARQGGCRGIAFDPEQYHRKLWDYRKQAHAGKRSWEEYAARARQRGRELMQAFQRGYPGVTVFLTFGYGLVWNQSMKGYTPLSELPDGLLVPFLDGMVEAVESPARLIDGHEPAYGFRDPAQFERTHRAIREDLVKFVGPKAKYRRVVSCGFGLWMDNDWRQHGWDTERPGRNYFDPATFEVSLTAALRVSDEYVWIYTETPRWWSEEGVPVKLPPAYDRAVRGARRAHAMD